MNLGQRIGRVAVVVGAFVFAGAGIAAPKTLIEMDGGQPKAAFAKSWKKVKDGDYTFDLDTTQELSKGVPVSPEAVKSSLESKLGTTHGVKVSAAGASSVDVTYTCKEDEFLDQVSKTRIRAKSVELALESSTSEGGIRAKIADRAPNAGEVKAKVLKAEKGVVTAMVNETKAANVKNNATIKIKADGEWKRSGWIFFVPEKEEGGIWTPKAGSVLAK